MKSSEICALAINIVAGNYGDTTYRMGNTDPVSTPYNNMTWLNGAWRSDCLGFLRAVLCGWNGNKNVLYGGSNTSYGCYVSYGGFTEQMFLSSCTIQSYDFSLLNIPCCMLYKRDPYEHVGLYVGEYQLNGFTYNVCECTSWYGDSSINGCKPTWIDPDGTRRYYKGGSVLGSAWLAWGQFNLNGTDYGITEYDGGATGATGFGSELSHDEVLYYWNTLPEYGSWLTYEFLVSLADKFYDMPESLFEMVIGWSRNEMYPFYDEYMGYLCDSIPLNGYMNGCDTQQKIVDWVRGTDPNYTIELFEYCANSVKNNQETYYPIIKSMYLVLMNPCQRVRFCSGMDTIPQDKIIYQATINGYLITAGEYLDGWENYSYDITGTGVRGGTPIPGSRGRKMPLYMYLRPYYNYNYRR